MKQMGFFPVAFWPPKPTLLLSFSREWCPISTFGWNQSAARPTYNLDPHLLSQIDFVQVPIVICKKTCCFLHKTSPTCISMQYVFLKLYPLHGFQLYPTIHHVSTSATQRSRNAMILFWVPSPTQRKFNPKCLPQALFKILQFLWYGDG